MKSYRRLLALILCMLMVMCSAVISVAEEEEPFTMVIQAQCYLSEFPPDDAEVLLIMEEYTGINLDIIWMVGNINEKISATLASGEDMPMCLYIENPSAYNIVNAARAGMFWELTPYIEQFPNLKEMYSEPVRVENASIAGGTYGLFRKRPLATTGIIFRKDWADNLGIDNPETIDEYYDMLYAFTHNDPDGNGVNDTYGLATKVDDASNINGFVTMMAAFDVPNEWKWDGETMIPYFVTDEYVECMDFYKKLYEEGLMNTDFVTNKEMHKQIDAGRAGSYISFMSNAASDNNDLYIMYPDAQLDIVGRLEDRCMAEKGFAGEFVFPVSSVKDEETLLKCMSFFDKLNDPEMQNLLRWGIEGKHYYVNEDGKLVRPAEWNDAYTNEVNCWRTIKLHYDEKAKDGVFDYAYGRARELYVENEPYAIGNPCAPLISDTQTEIGNDLKLIINDATIQYIVGEIGIEDFQAACDAWYAQGGDKIVAEYTEAYLANQ